MAIITKNYLDFTNLQAYDTLIKNWANSANQAGYKTILKTADGNTLNLYKKPNAVLGTDTPDATVALGGGDVQTQLNALASVVGATWVPESTDPSTGTTIPAHYTLNLDSTFGENTDTVVEALNELKGQINTLNGNDSTAGSVAKAIKDAIDALDVTEFAIAEVNSNVVTIHGVKEENGVISVGNTSANDIVLEEVAYTGAAEDVSVADTAGKLTATNVEDALAELADAAADQAVYMTDDTSTTGTDYAAIYKFYQGTGSAASPVAGELIGTINIPKDQFVNDAELVDIYFDDSDNTLHEGSISGPDVTDAIVGTGGTATAADAGKYFKIVFELTSGPSAKSTIYISIKELSHVYTGGSNDEITVSVNASTDVITATIGDVAATKVTYIAADAGTSTPRESVGAALTRLDADDTTTGSVAKKIKDAIGDLDTSSDVAIASYDSTTTAITLQNGIKEENGVIAQGTGDGIVISPIDTTDINSLFTS